MIKFLRISHLYPGALNSFVEKYPNLDSLKYKNTLRMLHAERYSVSNFYSMYLKKLNYQCIEIISNAKFLQNKWLQEYGKNKEINTDVLLQQITYYKPNVLYIGNADLCSKSFIDSVKKIKNIKLIIGYHCAPFNDKIYKNLLNVDAVVTCTEGYQKQLNSLTRKKVLYLPHAFHGAKETKLASRAIDIAFIGSIFIGDKLHNNRIDLIYKILNNFDNTYVAIHFSKFFLAKYLLFIIKSFGSISIIKNFHLLYKLFYIYLFAKKPIFGKNMYTIFAKTKIVVNTHIEDTKYAGNMRMFEATGSGCLLLSDKKKGYEKLFKLGKEIVLYENTKDLIDKCKFFLEKKKYLSNIAKNGFQKTSNRHTYLDRAKKINVFIKALI